MTQPRPALDPRAPAPRERAAVGGGGRQGPDAGRRCRSVAAPLLAVPLLLTLLAGCGPSGRGPGQAAGPSRTPSVSGQLDVAGSSPAPVPGSTPETPGSATGPAGSSAAGGSAAGGTGGPLPATGLSGAASPAAGHGAQAGPPPSSPASSPAGAGVRASSPAGSTASTPAGAAATASTPAGAAATGSGSTVAGLRLGPLPSGAPRAAALAAATLAALKRASSFTADGSLVDPDLGGYRLVIAASTADSRLTLRTATGAAEVREVGKQAYLLGDPGFYRQVGGSTASSSRFAGHWVHLPTVQASGFADLLDPARVLATDDGEGLVAATARLLGTTTVGRTPAWVLQGEGIVVAVPRAGAPLPLLVNPLDRAEGAGLTFRSWSAPVRVEVPPSPLELG